MVKTKQKDNLIKSENQYLLINDYLVIKTLGQGAYGTVYKAIKNNNNNNIMNIDENNSKSSNTLLLFNNNNNNNSKKQKKNNPQNINIIEKYYAIKAFDKDLSKNGIHPSILREIGILKELSIHHSSNELFIKLEDVLIENNRIYAIYEYGGISLLSFIEEKCSINYHNILNLQFGIKIFFQIVNSIQYLHNLGIVHRDLKPENILINENNLQIKIADFGLARSIRNHSYTNFTNDVVTIYYKSPELIIYSNMDNFSNNSIIPEFSLPFSIDSWSIGIIALELFHIICNQNIIWSPFFFEGNELSVLESIQNFLHPNHKIHNLKKILLPLFQNYPQVFYVISDLLELNPNKRCSCIQAFQILEKFI